MEPTLLTTAPHQEASHGALCRGRDFLWARGHRRNQRTERGRGGPYPQQLNARFTRLVTVPPAVRPATPCVGGTSLALANTGIATAPNQALMPEEPGDRTTRQQTGTSRAGSPRRLFGHSVQYFDGPIGSMRKLSGLDAAQMGDAA